MKIVKYPHSILRHSSVPLRGINARVQSIVAEMFDLMYEGKGLGLAAPQVMLPYQLFVMNLVHDPQVDRKMERVFINPVIIERHGSEEGEEGCLSFPELFQKVRRARQIRFKYYDLGGQLIDRASESELEARVVQHEVDHLHGVLFIDKMGPLARISSRGMVHDLEREHKRAVARGEIPPEDDLKKLYKELEDQA